MKKAFATSGGDYTINYTITFTNNTETTFSSGEVATEITSNTGSMLKDASTTISKREVKPGESVDVTMTFHVIILKKLKQQYHMTFKEKEGICIL